ncbi:large conductance mechanosensitive channel protein MscL, partial [Enterococcus lactis]|nr:large conductance mechanosensitive channel protein MscL [Enterococcus lactis]
DKTEERAKKILDKEAEEEAEETPTAEDYLSDIRDLLAKQVAEDNTHPVEQTNLSDTSK